MAAVEAPGASVRHFDAAEKGFKAADSGSAIAGWCFSRAVEPGASSAWSSLLAEDGSDAVADPCGARAWDRGWWEGASGEAERGDGRGGEG